MAGTIACPAFGQQAIIPDAVMGPGKIWTTDITAAEVGGQPTFVNFWIHRFPAEAVIVMDGVAIPPTVRMVAPGGAVRAGGSRFFVFSGSEQLVTAWITPIAVAGDGQKNKNLRFTGAYSYAPNGVKPVAGAAIEALLPFKRFSFTAIRKDGSETGLAMANPSADAAASVSCQVFGSGGGSAVAIVSVTLPPEGQLRGFLGREIGKEAIPANWDGGKVDCAATLPVAALTLKLQGDVFFSERVFSLD